MTKKATHTILTEKYISLLKDPKHFFTKVKKEHSIHPALFFAVTLTIFGGIINILITLPLLLQKIGSFQTVTWIAQLLTLVYLPIYTVIYAALAAVIILAILHLLKVQHNSFQTNFKIVAYTQTISIIYAICGTILVLAAELITGQSINTMLVSLFSGTVAQTPAMAIVYLIAAIPLTIASWVHVLWAMMHAFTSNYSMKKPAAIFLSIGSLLLSFVIIVGILSMVSL